VEQGAGDGQLLPHAARQLAGERAALVGELQLVEQRRHAARRVAHAVEARDELQVLLDGEVVEEVRLVGDEGELRLAATGSAARSTPATRTRPADGHEDAGAAAQRGGLAGAVDADEA
jgi:hypothetical protein